MFNADRIMGTKEAADCLGVTTQAFSNLRNRYKEDFPNPCVELTATPIYDRQDIEKWAEAHQRNYHSSEMITAWGSYKAIAICGRPRVGKSFLVSLYSEEPFVYRAACSKQGDDFTQCAVQHIIREDINEPHAIFHNRRKDDKSEDVEGMDGFECPLDPEKFPKYMDEIAGFLKDKRNNGENIEDIAYLEIFMRPSPMAREIMKKCNVKTLIITDTPGVSENYSLVPIEKADLVTLVIADSNQIEAQKSYQELVRGLAPLVASSKVCFLYRTSTMCEDEEDYLELQKEAKLAMASFSNYFSDWKGSIIESSMDILQPTTSVIGIPVMSKKSLCVAESMFVEGLKEKIVQGLSDEKISTNALINVITNENVEEEETANFIRFLLQKWRYEKIDKELEKEYTLSDFVKEKHDRVKSQDNYRLLYAAMAAGRRQLRNLYEDFKKYTDKDYPKVWQQTIIKYVYNLLSAAIKKDNGIAVGTHPWEDCPPITMYVIESVLTEKIRFDLLDENKKENKDFYKRYKRTMIENGVTSNSWNYVEIDLQNSDALKKLDLIIQSKLNQVRVGNLEDMVWSRYTLGLQVTAEYQIWKNIAKVYGYEENDIKKQAEYNMYLVNE